MLRYRLFILLNLLVHRPAGGTSCQTAVYPLAPPPTGPCLPASPAPRLRSFVEAHKAIVLTQPPPGNGTVRSTAVFGHGCLAPLNFCQVFSHTSVVTTSHRTSPGPRALRLPHEKANSASSHVPREESACVLPALPRYSYALVTR